MGKKITIIVVESMKSLMNLDLFNFDGEEAKIAENCCRYFRSRTTTKKQYPAAAVQRTNGGMKIKIMLGQLLSKDGTHPLMAKM
jgi:diaminopimelate epimerase